MALGPGKYDDLCTMVREQLGISEDGGVLLMVFGGKKGNGFACQADLRTTLAIPEILEDVAAQIRRDSIAGRS